MRYRQKLALSLGLILILILLLFFITNEKSRNFLHYQRSIDVKVYEKEPNPKPEVNESFSKAGREDTYNVRNCITNRILGKTLNELQTISFEHSEGNSPEIAEKRKSDFEDIFKNKLWAPPWKIKEENRESGPGSTLHYAQEVIGALNSIISQLKRDLNVDRIRLLDIPCGDMVWMSRFLKTRDDVDYTGLDIVPDLINRHQKSYANQPNWKFRVQDIVRNGLNESFDLILCRMMLQHLFNHDALTVLKHFSESGSRFLLTTSFNRINKNLELSSNSGRFRMLNMELPPFSLTPPICIVRDGDRGSDGGKHHSLGLWKLPIRRVKLCVSTTQFRVPGFDFDFFSCTDWS